MTTYIAIADNDNVDFSVKKNQVIASIELNDALFLDPETEEFDQDMHDTYFLNAVLSDPNGAIANIVGCTWIKSESEDVDVISPIISVPEEVE